jgi:hypothetical protein
MHRSKWVVKINVRKIIFVLYIKDGIYCRNIEPVCSVADNPCATDNFSEICWNYQLRQWLQNLYRLEGASSSLKSRWKIHADVYYRVHKSLPSKSIASRFNPFSYVTHYFSAINLNIVYLPKLIIPAGLFP